MEQNYNFYDEQENQGSLLKGILGALLGAIIGAIVAGVIYIVLEQSNTLLGFLIGLLTIKGYELLKGRKGIVKLVVSIICIILAVVLAESIFYASIIEKDYAEGLAMLEQYGIPETSPLYITRGEAYQMYFDDPAFWEAFGKDLGTSFLMVGGTALIAVLGLYFGGKKNEENATSDVSAAAVPQQDVQDAAVPAKEEPVTEAYLPASEEAPVADAAEETVLPENTDNTIQ